MGQKEVALQVSK